MTAKELIAMLKKLPPDTRIITVHYEGGYDDAYPPAVENITFLEENMYWDVTYMGDHELTTKDTGIRAVCI